MKTIVNRLIAYIKAQLKSMNVDRDYSAFRVYTLEDYKAELMAKYPGTFVQPRV